VRAAVEAAPEVGLAAACQALSISRASAYRDLRPAGGAEPGPEPGRHPRALDGAERAEVLAVLTSERFVDAAPREVYATLLDEGRYLCSVASMYRVLRVEAMTRERRRVARHPLYRKPELVATAPNEVWSWDITKLLGPVAWSYFYLYVILDIFSRYVVGWMVATRESAPLAEQLIAETYHRQGVEPGRLVLHSDRGPSMTSGLVAQLLAWLGVTKSHSRPHVSDDNPFSESQFKTLKYWSRWPERFGSLEQARAYCQAFFSWYNGQHRHSGIGLHTPEAVHYGLAASLDEARARTLLAAYAHHPERFVRGKPLPPALPAAVWINPPKPAVDPRSDSDPPLQ
jgi:putative transposase